MKRGCLPHFLCLAILLAVLLWRMLGAPVTPDHWKNLSTPLWQARVLLPSRVARMLELWPFSSVATQRTATPSLLEEEVGSDAMLLKNLALPQFGGKDGSGAQLSTLPSESITLAMFNTEADKIEQMPLEAYVCSVVAAEMPASYHLEALKAQAVAARTRAVAQSGTGLGCGCSLHEGADICTDSTHCQGFASVAQCQEKWGDEYPVYRQRVAEAVLATAGQILTYEGQPITVLYHAISGGQTEDAQTVFTQNLPYLVSVESKGEENLRGFSEDAIFSFSEAARLLDTAFPEEKLTAEKLQHTFAIASYTPSGRVDSLIIGDGQKPATAVRQALGLRSTWFSISMDETGITFHQRGYGHGVGMSQAGANVMAAENNSYQAILAHYYQGVTLEALRP